MTKQEALNQASKCLTIFCLLPHKPTEYEYSPECQRSDSARHKVSAPLIGIFLDHGADPNQSLRDITPRKGFLMAVRHDSKKSSTTNKCIQTATREFLEHGADPREDTVGNIWISSPMGTDYYRC
jgi:hypothetical protein